MLPGNVGTGTGTGTALFETGYFGTSRVLRYVEESCVARSHQEYCSKCHKGMSVVALPLYFEKPSVQDLPFTCANPIYSNFDSLYSYIYKYILEEFTEWTIQRLNLVFDISLLCFLGFTYWRGARDEKSWTNIRCELKTSKLALGDKLWDQLLWAYI